MPCMYSIIINYPKLVRRDDALGIIIYTCNNNCLFFNFLSYYKSLTLRLLLFSVCCAAPLSYQTVSLLLTHSYPPLEPRLSLLPLHW